MSVTLTPPNQLGFPRPLTQIVKRSLFIQNNNSSPVAFKVKTTAPKQYCVRPNQGRVEPGEKIEVQIALQPLPADPPPHAKCKDKFLVQSVFIPPEDEVIGLPEMWAQIEKTNKGSIQEQKIRCAYLTPESGTANPNGIPEENEDPSSPLDNSRLDESAIYSAAEQSHENGGDISRDVGETAAIGAGAGIAAGAGAAGLAAHKDRKEIPSLSAADVQGIGAPTNVALEKSLAATTSPEEKLNVALKEIDRLKSELQAAKEPQVIGLRKRGGGMVPLEQGHTSAGTATTTKNAPAAMASGVPLEVCAGLVFTVFVLTYLFF